jgi:hypothetical protein
MKMEQTGCSETLAYKIQTLANYPEESIQHARTHLLYHRVIVKIFSHASIVLKVRKSKNCAAPE